MRLEAHGGYDFSYLRFVREPRDSDEAEQPTGPWRPAAGSFEGWPRAPAELRVLDPCCGNGHFLVECLDLQVRLRMEDERLAPGAAVEVVLRDNLFGLEIDPRCTQIAAFNLALAAWTWPGAERTDFSGSSDFDGNRWNDLYYTNAVRHAARARPMLEAKS